MVVLDNTCVLTVWELSLSSCSHFFSCHQFIIRGLPMLHKMVEQGYYLPTLKVLGNVTPLMFKNRKMFVNEQRYAVYINL